MGGTSDVTVGHPANGLPLCGSGTWGSHGWTEGHPRMAALLGWRLVSGQDALGSAFWTRFGWRKWVEVDGCPVVAYVDPDEDLDELPAREEAVQAYLAARARDARK